MADIQDGLCLYIFPDYSLVDKATATQATPNQRMPRNTDFTCSRLVIASVCVAKWTANFAINIVQLNDAQTMSNNITKLYIFSVSVAFLHQEFLFRR